MPIQRLFPSLIQQQRLFSLKSKLHQELLQECYKFRALDKSGRKWSKSNYRGGYTSYGSLTNLFEISSTFALLKSQIDKAVRIYIRELDMDVHPKDVQMCSLWINIMPARVHHSMHIHPLSVVSGSYYLQVPKGAPGLKLEDPRLLGFMASPPRKSKARKENLRFVELAPKAGEVVLFESWLRHEVPANTAKQDRVSISFNYHWV
jgi:uncharacterized protein (TIGR02466 family)